MNYLQFFQVMLTGEWTNTQIIKLKNIYCIYYPKIKLYEHINWLYSTILCTCATYKQDKHFSNQKIIIRVPFKTKHHNSKICYGESKRYRLNLRWVLRMKIIVEVGWNQQKYWGYWNFLGSVLIKILQEDRRTCSRLREDYKILISTRGYPGIDKYIILHYNHLQK